MDFVLQQQNNEKMASMDSCEALLRLFWALTFSCTFINVSSQDKSPLLLSCGSTADATDSNARKWTPDSKFIDFHFPNKSVSASAQSQDPSLPSAVPYMTARIFTCKTSYQFSLSSNLRHIIRLHFYPSLYANYDTATSFFSVTSGAFTHLNNFSASITAEALTQAYIVREFFMVRQESGMLNLTFLPSPNSFAFINGIEVVPVPEIFQPVSMVGSSDKNMDVESHTLQTMFRLNVGGQFISPNDDSGLTRMWYDDSPYIYGAGFGVTTEADKNVTISYPSKEAEPIAPLDIYRTARSMGPNSTVNVNYNLTWAFQIDIGFTYLVRLHFCEFQLDKVNQMVFSIYINNQTAELDADVIAWSVKKGVPVYKDYAIYVSSKTGSDQLWIALHPNVKVKPEFYDAILNGLEIYKLSDSKRNLAGPNPAPSHEKTEADAEQGSFSHPPSQSSKRGMIVGSAVGSVVGFSIVIGLVVFCLHRRKRTYKESWLPISGISRSAGTSKISSLGGGLCRHFSLAELRLATDNFNESHVIGVGGFGKVYRGSIDGNTKSVAIKRANLSSEQGVKEFLNEIELLSKLRHQHLVSLIGACEENDEMILVYDYMANGTLREHLYNNDKPYLTWVQRLRICIGAARGIHYLHTGAKYTIIHRDVKSTNILLDEKWVAKVSDFGLSRTEHKLDQTHVSTVVKGSFGYLDPEYFRRQLLTDKSDIYSFGVVLFEVLCGRPAVNPSLRKEEVSLADWVILNWKKNSLGEIVDPQIKDEMNDECLRHFCETGVKCLSDYGCDRPSMGQVLWSLEYCLHLQKNPDATQGEAKQRANEACETFFKIEEEADDSGIEVFSEIMDPRGR